MASTLRRFVQRSGLRTLGCRKKSSKRARLLIFRGAANELSPWHAQRTIEADGPDQHWPVPVGSESQLWPGRGERQVPATQSGSGKATVDRKSTFRSLANVDFAEFTSDLFDFEYGRVTPTRGLPAVRWIAAAAASCTATPLNRAGTSRRRGRRVALTWPSCRSILRSGQ